MTTRTALKSLAFVAGLYFVLEFLLPAKMGGDFDSFELAAPVPVSVNGTNLLFYSGQYRTDRGGVGRMVRNAAASNKWNRVPNGPVLERSLFVPWDRWGMDQLDAVAVSNSVCMLYIGRNAQQSRTLCHASSDNAGIAWRARGIALMSDGGVPRPSIENPNGRLPGPLEFFAADWREGQWTLWLVMTTKSHGRSVWRATGARLEALVVASEPLLSGPQIPANVTAFDAYRAGNADMFLIATGTAVIAGCVSNGATAWQPIAASVPTNMGDVVSLRHDHAGDVYMGTMGSRSSAVPPEWSPNATAMLELRAGKAIATGIPTFSRLPTPTYLSRGTKVAGQFLQIIGSFAVFLAMINLVAFHSTKISRGEQRAYNSVIFLVFLAVMLPCAFFGTPTTAQGTLWRRGFDFLFNAIQVPMGSAVFSMITFYMISAAYRSFRVRSLEAGLLMGSAVLVMVGQMPIGEWLGLLVPDSLPALKVPWLAQKMLTVVNAAAYRGVLIGMLVGGLAISLRIWLGLDDSAYSGLDKKK